MFTANGRVYVQQLTGRVQKWRHETQRQLKLMGHLTISRFAVHRTDAPKNAEYLLNVSLRSASSAIVYSFLKRPVVIRLSGINLV
jgi:hypothetical protein